MSRTQQVSIISLIFIISIPLLLMFQGIDFTDTGWMLTYFQNIFHSPESVSFWFHLYLTHIIGGVWEILFGSFGLIGYKFAGVIIFWLTSLLIYKIYKDIISKEYIWGGIALGLVYNFSGKITIIHYNNLSLLFFVLTVYFIKKGLTKSSRYLFLAGICVALNSFIRLPNILSALLIIAVIYYELNSKYILLSISGFVLGIAIVFLLMFKLGHTNIYLDSVFKLFSSTDDNLSHYGSSTISNKFIKDIFKSIFIPISGLLVLLPFSYLINKYSKKTIIFIFLLFIFIAFSIIISYFISTHSSLLFFTMIGLIFITSSLILYSKNKMSKIIKAITIMVFLTITSLSLGSDTGMKVGSYGIILGMPLFLWFWSEKKVYNKSFKNTLNYIITFFIISSIPLLYGGTYRDSSNRLAMNSYVSNKLLCRVKTTADRTRVINELLDELNNLNIENSTLLCFESIGMVNYLTKTKPYVSNTWPLIEMPNDLEKMLSKNEKIFLPTIVIAKKQTRSQGWPNSGQVNQSKVDIENRKVIYNFIEKHNYSVVWSNSMFKILNPSSL